MSGGPTSGDLAWHEIQKLERRVKQLESNVGALLAAARINSGASGTGEGGVWVSTSHDFGWDSVFATEVEASRHALDFSQFVTFVPFGKSVHDVEMEAINAKRKAAQ